MVAFCLFSILVIIVQSLLLIEGIRSSENFHTLDSNEMENTPSDLPACNACRSQKRKCDKLQPTCSQCSIRAQSCIYSSNVKTNKRRPSPQAIDRHAAADVNQASSCSCCPGILSAVRELRAPQVNFPPMVYLDQSMYHELRPHIPTTATYNTLSPYLLTELGEAEADIPKYVSSYFNSIQKWLPVISEERFYACLKEPRSQLPVDVTLLLLCMRLITSNPHKCLDGQRCELYLASKEGIAYLEGAGILSLSGLRAGLLISLYEIGHAIYPNAFLSIGACIRYGLAMGLGGRNEYKLQRPLNKSDHEESRRLWWAVILLDRFVHLGRVAPAGLVEDPLDDLPISTAINSEELQAATRFSDDRQKRQDQGCFALLIEATKLLGQVLRNTSSRQSGGPLDQEVQLNEELYQLDNTLKSLIFAAEQEANKWDVDIHSQLTICYSAILSLHQSQWKRLRQQSTNLEWDDKLQSAIKLVTDRVILMCKEILLEPELMSDSASPFLLHSIYTVALANSTQKSMSPENKHIMQKALEKLGNRWKAAGAYLEILEAYKVLWL